MNPAIRGSAASARIPSRSAPSANMRVEIWSSIGAPYRSLGRPPDGDLRLSSLTRAARPSSCAAASPRSVAQQLLRGRAPSACGHCPAYSISTVRQPAASSCGRRRCRCRRASRRTRDRARAPPRHRTSMPGAGLRQSHGPESSGNDAVGVMQAQQREARLRTPCRASSSITRSWTASSSSSATLPLAAAGWFETHTSAYPASASSLTAAAAPGSRRTSSALSGDSGRPDSGSRDGLVERAVSIEERSGSDRTPARHRRRQA